MWLRVVIGGVVLLAGSASTTASPAEPLQHLEGSLFQMHSLTEITNTTLGTFRLESADPGDLRTTPGTAELTLSSGGTLTKSVGVVNEARKVDHISGRPLRSGGTTCETGAEIGCLPASHCLPTLDLDPMGECDVSVDVNAFRTIDDGAIHISIGDLTVGLLMIFNSVPNFLTNQPATDPLTQPTLASFASALLAANSGALGFASNPALFDAQLPAIRLHRDVGDTRPGAGFFSFNPAFDTLNRVLAPQQQALLGCGPFYGAPSEEADCDVYGISLLLTEAEALFQAWPGFHALGHDWDLTDPTLRQPGTVDFEGGPACTRLAGVADTIQLPGCRGPEDPAYDVVADGTTTGLMIPFFDPSSPFYQGPFDLDGDSVPESPTAAFDPTFENEIAAISWNLQMLLVGFSSIHIVDANPDQVLDPNDFFRTDGCSFATPQLCFFATRLLAHMTRELADAPSGPPRRRWVWETGAEHLQTDDATGGLANFADWTFHVLGPEVSRRGGSDEAGVLFVLGPPDDIVTPPDSPLVVTGPEGFVGLAYGVVPEPSGVWLRLAGLLIAAGLARVHQRVRGRCGWRWRIGVLADDRPPIGPEEPDSPSQGASVVNRACLRLRRGPGRMP